jgi:hypothetical protein
MDGCFAKNVQEDTTIGCTITAGFATREADEDIKIPSQQDPV